MFLPLSRTERCSRIRINELLSNKLFKLFGISWIVFAWILLEKKRTVLANGYLFVRSGKIQSREKIVKSYSIILEPILTYLSLWYLSGPEKGKKEKYETSVKGKKAVVELLMKIRIAVWVV